MRENQPLAFAILGQESNAGANRVTRSVDFERLSIEEDFSRRPRIRTENRPRHLGSPGADQAGDAKHLARANLERYIANAGWTREPAHCKAHVAARHVALREFLRQLAPDHQADQLRTAGVGHGAAASVGAVAQYRDAVAHTENLLQ